MALSGQETFFELFSIFSVLFLSHWVPVPKSFFGVTRAPPGQSRGALQEGREMHLYRDSASHLCTMPLVSARWQVHTNGLQRTGFRARFNEKKVMTAFPENGILLVQRAGKIGASANASLGKLIVDVVFLRF